MHMTIGVITYANNRDEAKEQSVSIFEKLTENQTPFDYFDIYGQTLNVATKTGQSKIKSLWDATIRDFKHNMEIVRKHLPLYTDDDLLKGGYAKHEKADWDTGMVLHFMYSAGSYKGSSWWLYDNDGEAIRDEKHLANVLSKWANLYEEEHKPNPCKEQQVWVTTADVHY